MDTKLTLLINTHTTGKPAVDLLVESLRACKEFSEFNIVICEGGYMDNSDYHFSYENNITHIKCNHNSIDFTSFITVVENIDQEPFCSSSHFFYMHDTCKVGPTFLQKLSQIDLAQVELGIRLTTRFGKNIGLYSKHCINRGAAWLKRDAKCTDESELLNVKEKGYRWEDNLFNMSGLKWKITEAFCDKKGNRGNLIPDTKEQGLVDWYGTGRLRVLLYYPGLDLYKLQANVGPRHWANEQLQQARGSDKRGTLDL